MVINLCAFNLMKKEVHMLYNIIKDIQSLSLVEKLNPFVIRKTNYTTSIHESATFGAFGMCLNLIQVSS